ncbi:hypothetical protein TIFTF001_007708 [Ficus carica]|uniref:Uncharacterized protein n=1 Tax=Ficus carica TaxID=3494 RepID=A0AA88A756_FICCA|nr:hypothetical protein TIFTF001_007708 [Ficus carica]
MSGCWVDGSLFCRLGEREADKRKEKEIRGESSCAGDFTAAAKRAGRRQSRRGYCVSPHDYGVVGLLISSLRSFGLSLVDCEWQGR